MEDSTFSRNKISIIVPVYNTEKYLDECIQSVLEQTYTNWELLLIDDGSTDSSGTICDKYAAEDSRILVFHKENGGVSSARNIGLAHAKGEWVIFIDSDDWIDERYLYEILSEAENVDLVITGATLYDQGRKMIRNTGIYKPTKVEKQSFDMLFASYDLHFRTSPWGKLFKNNIIIKHHILFDEKMHHSEDAVFLYRYLLYCESVHMHSGHHYCYRYEQTDSLTKKVFNYSTEKYHFHELIESIERIKSQLDIWSHAAIDNLLLRQNASVDRVLNALYHSTLKTKDRIRAIKSLNINKSILKIARGRKEKLLYTLLRYKMYWIYDILRSLAIYSKCNHI